MGANRSSEIEEKLSELERFAAIPAGTLLAIAFHSFEDDGPGPFHQRHDLPMSVHKAKKALGPLRFSAAQSLAIALTCDNLEKNKNATPDLVESFNANGWLELGRAIGLLEAAAIKEKTASHGGKGRAKKYSLEKEKVIAIWRKEFSSSGSASKVAEDLVGRVNLSVREIAAQISEAKKQDATKNVP